MWHDWTLRANLSYRQTFSGFISSFQKNKGKRAEANFVNEASTSGPTLDVSDFFNEDVNLHKLDPQEKDNYIFRDD